MCSQGSPSTISPWLRRICFGAVGSYGCRQTAVAPAVCREQVVVSELLVPTPLESEMMSLVSPALLSVNIHALRINWNRWSFGVTKARLGDILLFFLLPRYWTSFLHNFMIVLIAYFSTFSYGMAVAIVNSCYHRKTTENTRLPHSSNYEISWLTLESEYWNYHLLQISVYLNN